MRALRKTIKKLFASMGIDIRRTNPADGNFGWLEPYRIQTVIDIGANEGLFASEILATLPDAAIYSFEPLADCYRKLCETMRSVPKFRAFPYALGDRDANVEMYRSEFSASSSLLPMGQLHKELFPHTQDLQPEAVTLRTLDGVMQDIERANNLLVKIDVQGTEDKVILGGQETIAGSAVVIAETSFRELYEGQPLFATVYGLLADMGFQYAGTLDPQRKNPLDGGVLQADAIFVNPRRRADPADE